MNYHQNRETISKFHHPPKRNKKTKTGEGGEGGEGGELFLGEKMNQSKGVHDKNDEDDIDAE